MKLRLLKIAFFGAFILAGLGSAAASPRQARPLHSPELGDYSTLRWNPTKVTQYLPPYTGASTWDISMTTDYAYDANGQVISETTYNSMGTPQQRTEYVYDSMVPSMVVKRTVLTYANGSWIPAGWGGESVTVERNAQGNIVKAVETESDRQTTTMLVEYGADNRPVTITINDSDGDHGVYSDIVWERYDGQFVIFDDMDDMIRTITSGNAVKSCTYTDRETRETLTVEYLPNAYSYVCREVELYGSDAETTETTGTITITDENGSYEVVEEEKQWHNNNPAYVETERMTESYTFDKFGICLEEVTTETNEPTMRRTTAVTYSPATGLPATAVYTSGMYTTKYVFEGGTSAITTVEADDASSDAPAEYYTLQGVRVDNPESGIYLVRRGTTVSKVLVQ